MVVRWFAIFALLVGCGRVGYDAEAIDTIGLADGGGADSDPLAPDASPSGPADSGMSVIDGAMSAPDAAGDPMSLAVNGNYSTAPVQYSCAIGLVSVDLTAFTFADDGQTLTVTSNDSGAPAQPCVMTGPSAEATGNINVTCTLPGGCDEIYTLTGMYTDGDNWSGSLTMDFVGSCLNCTNQVVAVSGSRCNGGCPAQPSQ
jgi:hypothetical protein